MRGREAWRTLRRRLHVRAVLLGCLALLAMAAVAWALDIGGLLGGTTRRELAARVDALSVEVGRAQAEASTLRRRSSELETQLAMEKGTEEALNRQVTDLSTENARLKEDLAFLQRLVADSSEPAGVTIPRLTLERESDQAWHYAVLVVRGGTPAEDYHGALVLEATLAPGTKAGAAVQAVTLPADQPDSAGNLTLRFKYYQRVEGTLRVPPGSRVTALTAKVYEDGNTTPRASRTLTKP